MPAEIGFHWHLLNDYDRNAAYQEALLNVVPERIVYDLGAGLGLMSYYALRAGAKRVYGFEVDQQVYPYLRKLSRRYSNFVPVQADVVRDAWPKELPNVVVCEMWSAWLIDWPMVRVLNRIRRRVSKVTMIPARGLHMAQLVRAHHRSDFHLQPEAKTEGALFGEPLAISEMSLPAVAAVTDFRDEVSSVDVVVQLTPLTTGIVNAVRLYSYEEVFDGHILPRTGTRKDELLRWIDPVRVRRGRRVRLRIKHHWDSKLRVNLE